MPVTAREPARAPATSVHALLRFTVLWMLAGALAAVGLVYVLDRTDGASLPPLQATQLEIAAADAGCRLQRDTGLPHDPRLLQSLRRGKILIRHGPELPPDRVQQIELIRRRLPTATLVAVDPSLAGSAVTADAWRRTLRCGGLTHGTIDALRLFRARHIGRGPEAG